MHRLLRLEWDAVAGVIAAVVALVLHFLHVIETDVLTMLTLVLIALLFLRILRHEQRTAGVAAGVLRSEGLLNDLARSARAPDVVVLGPRELRQASGAFAGRAQGEMIWFNVCLSMFAPQPLFDALLRPAIDNPAVTAITFVLDEAQRPLWEAHVWPKVVAGGGTGKVTPPRWRALEQDLSFVLADMQPTGTPECLLSFWGEPFMSRRVERDLPRYILHVRGHSELVGRLAEMEREQRLSG